MKYYFARLAADFPYKTIISILGGLFTLIRGFYSDLLWGFLSLFLIDLLTGLLKSKHNKVPITSSRLRDSVTKLGAYMLLITSLIISTKYDDAFKPIVNMAYYYFMLTELKSIKENVEAMGVVLPFFISKMMTKGDSYLKEEDVKKNKENKDDK